MVCALRSGGGRRERQQHHRLLRCDRADARVSRARQRHLQRCGCRRLGLDGLDWWSSLAAQRPAACRAEMRAALRAGNLDFIPASYYYDTIK
eukprot:SAG31_NODE_3818_length_3853_cov_10.567395_4_plen_92_part_00